MPWLIAHAVAIAAVTAVVALFNQVETAVINTDTLIHKVEEHHAAEER